uniref:Telomere length regulation protein TEL2 homolog n=1 Tax=Denticeps clupeoides TaxID=299321 RepID=A0AAY4BFR8_9TELE
MASADGEGNVRLAVAQCIKTLTSAKDTDDITKVLRQLLCYLEDGHHGNIPSEQRLEFCRSHYTRVLQALVKGLSADWFHRMTAAQRKAWWDRQFLSGPPDQALLILLDAITASSPSLGLEHLVCVLEEFLRTGRIETLLWSRTEKENTGDSPQFREVVLGRLVGLPSITANKLHPQIPAAFLPQPYCQLLGSAILNTLEKTCQALRSGQDCFLSFLAETLGKACAQGYGALLFGSLAPQLSAHTHFDALWCRVCVKLLENVPDRWMEAVVTSLIQTVDCPEALSRIMGNVALKNTKAQFVITHKLILLQYHHKVSVVRNLLGYLALDDERRPLLTQLLQGVCNAWSNKSAIKHTPVEQQMYVSKALLLCLNLLNAQELEQLHSDLLQCLLSGVQCHLDSNVLLIRRIGMVVGECISQKLDTHSTQLSFQYEPDDDSRELLAMMQPVDNNPTYILNSIFLLILFSDDELTPYDMPADQERQKSATPRYVRDCLEGLINSDDADRVAACLWAAADLLRKNPTVTQEVSTEFTKVMLHLEDKYNTLNFTSLRHNTMVALTVTDPQPVTDYLTTEFYSLNYNLRQRLDILEVLALSAHELSQPITKKPDCTPPAAMVTAFDQYSDLVHWKQVVEQRIRSKTKYISKGPSQAPPSAQPNRYAPVAGCFFFPLLRNYDRPQVTFDLLGSDHMVLSRLLNTLGMLVHLAVNAPVVTQMGKALMDFVWALRFHADQCVRRGVLVCVCAVFMSMPSQNLLIELNEDVLDTRTWLADVAETDVDADCRSLAVQSLVLLDKNLKKELQP